MYTWPEWEAIVTSQLDKCNFFISYTQIVHSVPFSRIHAHNLRFKANITKTYLSVISMILPSACSAVSITDIVDVSGINKDIMSYRIRQLL